jgi:phage-related protein
MRAALSILVAALALVAAGCGGDDEEASSTTDWANELCTAVQDWTDELEAVGTAVTSSPSEESLREAASDLDAATEQFLEDVRDLGAPETESRDEAEQAIEELADTIEGEKQEIQDAVDDVQGITGITSAVSSVAASLTAMGEAFQETFDRLETLDASGELEQAFDDAEACDELNGS